MAKTISEALAFVAQKMNNNPVKEKDFVEALGVLSDAIRAADEYFHTECKTLSNRKKTYIAGFSNTYELLRKEVMALETCLSRKDNRGAGNGLRQCNSYLEVLKIYADDIKKNL